MDAETPPASGNVYTDALIKLRWVGTALTYSFPTDAADFTGYDNTTVPAEEPFDNFEGFNATQITAVNAILTQISSFSSLTFTQGTGANIPTSVMRFGMTDATSPAHAYLPTSLDQGGDVWLNNSSGDLDNPIKGEFAYLTLMHEIGHALGLNHPHDAVPAMPADRDSVSYTVMSYRSYESAPLGYFNADGSYAHTYMMEDIRALQYVYGANFAYNNTDTTYTWDETTGEMSINSVGQGAPIAFGIYLTVWDGGGTDTYDFSNFGSGGTIDLRPGMWSGLTGLLPDTGGAVPGNIANAHLYNSDVRSLIENAIGTGGDDTMEGNTADNQLTGGAGADAIHGHEGDDLLFAGTGNDSLYGDENDDGLYFGASFTTADLANGGAGTNDQLALQGSYPALTLNANSLIDVELLALLSGSDTRFGDTANNLYSYAITTIDSNVDATERLIVSSNTLRVGENMTFNGAAESNGYFLTLAGNGIDDVTGGQQNDGFYFGVGRWGSTDSVDGQGGTGDQLGLQGDYALVFGATQLAGIESIVLLSATNTVYGGGADSFSYSLTMNDGNVAATQTMYIVGNALVAGEVLTFNGAAEINGRFEIYSGAADDTIAGGLGGDKIYGAGGADTLTGGLGNDTFAYVSAAHSTTASRDSIQDFTTGDLIDLSAIDANSVAGGNQAFSFIGSAVFGGLGAASAGQLRAVNTAGPTWLVQGDTDGNGFADFELQVVVSDASPIAAADFFL